MAGRDYTQPETVAMTGQPAATTTPTTTTPATTTPATTTPATTTPATTTPATPATPATPLTPEQKKAAADKAAAAKELETIKMLSGAFPVKGYTPEMLAKIPDDQLAQYARSYQGEPGGAYRVVNGDLVKTGHGVKVPKGQAEAMYQYAMQKIGREGQRANDRFSQAMTNRKGGLEANRRSGWDDRSGAGARGTASTGRRRARDRADRATRGIKFEEGGVIPEVNNFAEGGAVSDREATFQRYLREEKGDRDRAAKRMAALEKRPTSSAYDPDGKYFKPKPKPKTTTASPTLPSTAPTPTSRPDVETKTSSTGAADYSRRHVGGAGSTPASFEQDKPKRRVGGAGSTPASFTEREAEPKAQAAGTPTEGYERRHRRLARRLKATSRRHRQLALPPRDTSQPSPSRRSPRTVLPATSRR